MKSDNIFEPQVVSIFSVQKMSLCAKGIPSRSRGLLLLYLVSASLAWDKASSSVTVI